MDSIELDGDEEIDFLITRNIILRNYQLSLLEEAKKSNSIIYLPTGAGKTLIAVHLLISRTNDIIASPDGNRKKAFFIATTKVMVFQLYKVLKTHTKFKIVFYTGDMNVDCWCRSKWDDEIAKNDVLVLTAEILRQLLTLNFISPKDISLIVFDECHHAVANHPYKLILKILADDSSDATLLLGLTSVLLISTPKKNQISQDLKSLENSFRGKIITETRFQEIYSFLAKPVEDVVTYGKPTNSEVTDLLDKLIDNAMEILSDISLKPPDSPDIPKGAKSFKDYNKTKRIKSAFENCKNCLHDLGLYGGSLAVLFYIVILEKYRINSDDADEVQFIIFARTEMHKLRHILQKVMEDDESPHTIIKYSSPQVSELLNLIQKTEKNAGKKNNSTIVFVEKRVTAIILTSILKNLSAVSNFFSFVRPEFVIGSSTLTNNSYFMSCKNEEIIRKFSTGVLNILIATNILEEGIDFPCCNIVINFDFPKTYSSYLQSKGRSRYRESIYYVFINEDEYEEKFRILESFRIVETEISQTISMNHKIAEMGVSEDFLEKIYITGKNGIVSVDGITAIRAVNRYCLKLPQDKYSLLSPTSWYINVDNQKKAFVQLPMNCPLREVVEGEFRLNCRLAKRSAFLAVVKRLWEMNVLDEDLNPKFLKVDVNDHKNIFPHYKKENIDKNLPQPGTKQRKQMYKMKFAKSLSGCLPRPGATTYLHVIDLSVEFKKPELQRKVIIHEILQLPVTFALVSSKKLRKILQFPLFIDLGRINCDLLVNYDEIILTESEIKDIQGFHFTLFEKITKILKDFQIFDNRNKEHSFFIAPVEKNEQGRFVLNWDLIRCDFCKNSQSALVRYNPSSSRKGKTFESFEWKNEVDPNERSTSLVPVSEIKGQWLRTRTKEDERPKFAMTEADYKYFVVFPNYRNEDPPQYYIVNRLCHDMSPLTPFPRKPFEDYLSYYKEKYFIEITNSSQPLLRVTPLYTCTNFNRPKNRILKSKRDKDKEYVEHFIPELCDFIPFDRRFWLKAIFLPTVLNRIYHVYLVEEFRRFLVSETGLGLCELPEGSTWMPLEVDNACLNDEKEEGINAINGSMNLKSLLPLSKLKDKTKINTAVFSDPERNLNEIGICDLEFYERNLKEAEFDDVNNQQEENDEIINLVSIRNSSAPTLNLLTPPIDKFGPDLAQLIQTFTSKSANDIIDYERLEILGDSFLKFATTFFLFRNYEENEGILTSLKGKLVGNRNLMYCGLNKGIQDIINVTDFVPLSDWNPPLFYFPERLANGIISKNIDPAVLYRFEIPAEERFSGVLSEYTFQKNEQILEGYEKCSECPINSLVPYKTIGDKTIGDCVEALIGIYLTTLGLNGAFDILLWLGILPKPKGSYSEVVTKAYESPLWNPRNNDMILSMLEEAFYSGLEDTLNYSFKNKALLLEALTHPSYSRNRITDCYQRLEFLGDAVIDFMITTYVYENFSNLNPGQVTDIRTSLVNNITFACLVVRYELHKYLLSFSSSLNNAVETFVDFQTSRNHVIDDNVLILSSENDCMIAESVQAPKALGDLFEALAGAIYLDSGNSLETVWNVYYKLMKREIDEFTKNIPKSAVRLLQEICGDRPYYESKVIDGRTKITCSIYYENQLIEAHGFGNNRKEAKRSAAKLALNKIMTLKKG